MDRKQVTLVAPGRCVQFNHNGFRLGKVLRIRGSFVTVVLAPFTTRGRFPGKRMRVHKERIIGIVWRKKIVPIKPGTAEVVRCRG